MVRNEGVVHMVVRESPTVEYKESVTPTFLKTVSAYANYGTGKIEFGVDDEGVACGSGCRMPAHREHD